ncbi:MAG: hypothetical protein OXC82_11105 [Rhodobacteraceae bacterium]|nr:hypothetical protein [Paracoccaceae bacterium]MCY4250963.1 hypothetical protein [Paracoccaceae bacterium]
MHDLQVVVRPVVMGLRPRQWAGCCRGALTGMTKRQASLWRPGSFTPSGMSMPDGPGKRGRLKRRVGHNRSGACGIIRRRSCCL